MRPIVGFLSTNGGWSWQQDPIYWHNRRTARTAIFHVLPHNCSCI